MLLLTFGAAKLMNPKSSYFLLVVNHNDVRHKSRMMLKLFLNERFAFGSVNRQ
jgi:hypothetical protein